MFVVNFFSNLSSSVLKIRAKNDKFIRVSKNPPSPWRGWRGLVGAGGLDPVFSPLGEKPCMWGKMCLKNRVFGGWGAGTGG